MQPDTEQLMKKLHASLCPDKLEVEIRDKFLALEAEVFALTSEVANKAEYAASMYRMYEDAKLECDVALAHLAITEEANSMMLARNKWLEHTLEVAGASPVEPLTKTQIEKGMMALLWCAASDLERLNPNMYEGYKDDVTRVYSAITTETTRNS